MKVRFPQSFDFNQMLVFSVFWHLLILTVVLFLPKPTFPENTVVPAFMVNLVSEPTGYKVIASKPLTPRVIAKKEVSAKKPKAKIVPVEKKSAPKKSVNKSRVAKPPAIKIPKPNKALEELKNLEGKAVLATPNLVEELDQLARLEKPKIKPNVAEPIKQKPIAEKIFQDLETLRNKKINDKKIVAPVPRHEDILENFEDLKMKESLPETPRNEASQEKQQEPVSDNNKPKKPKTPEMDLLKELEQLAKIDASPILVPDVKTETPETAKSTQKNGEFYDSILKKFDSLLVDSEPIKAEISSARESGTGDSYVFAKKGGTPGAYVRSLYVGMIQEKIYKNWREPLAEEHNQETVVSFYVFPRGNIDKPFIKKSSGMDALDTLAVRAVLDSVPFPEFPKKLKISNLHVNIYFKYVPKDE